MEFLNFVMALSPIIVVLVGILGFRQSAKKVAPVALIWTLVLAFTYFNITGASFKENVAVYDALLWKGIKEGLKIVLMVFGAFVILNLLRDTGASLGNLICPNNTVAACATVDQIGNENKVMKRTLPAFAIILGVYMVLTMLYTCVLFPHFGM